MEHTADVHQELVFPDCSVQFVIGDAKKVRFPEEIHLVVTSPPYYNFVKYSERGIENLSYEEYFLALKEVFRRIYENLTPGGTVCINVTNVKSRKKN